MKYTFILITIFGLASCSNKNEPNHQIETNVVLNNGERWEANPETTEGINNMINHIDEFQNQSSSDYMGLKGNLTTEFQTIFKKCTMKGEAHDQLHNYLIPLKKEIDQISEQNIEQTRAYLKDYGKFFN
jgi:hypothetical protein